MVLAVTGIVGEAPPPIIIDIEASGFGRGSYPIEVGFALADQTTHCVLIRPDPDWTHWCPDAARVHGITQEILRRRGQPPAEVARWLNRHLHGQQVYSDAWSHDLSWLGKLFEASGIMQGFRLEALQSRLSEQQLRLWRPTRDQVVRELGIIRHRASSDALVIQHTYLRTRALDQGASSNQGSNRSDNAGERCKVSNIK